MSCQDSIDTECSRRVDPPTSGRRRGNDRRPNFRRPEVGGHLGTRSLTFRPVGSANFSLMKFFHHLSTWLLFSFALIDLRAAPVDIGSRRELFVDDLLVEQLQGARFKQGAPVPREVAISNDKPWDGIALFAMGMFVRDGFVHLYYRAIGEDRKATIIAYARSRDGIHWDKPELGLVDWSGSKANNLVQGPDGGAFPLVRASFFLDPRPGVPESERIKVIVFQNLNRVWGGSGMDPAMGLGGVPQSEIWVSGDGFRFRRSGISCQLTSRLVNAFDGTVVFWSEAEQSFVGFFRWADEVPVDRPDTHPLFRGAKGEKRLMRSIFRETSTDLVHWSYNRPMSFGETPREELYESGAFPYFRAPYQYIGLANRFFHNRNAFTAEEAAKVNAIGERLAPIPGHPVREETYKDDSNDMVLLATRPGSTTFARLFMEAFLRPGTDLGNWTSRNNYSGSFVFQTGPDEMSFLVMRHFRQPDNHFQRFSLRLDGFASINAPYSGGEMTTVPVIFSGDRLELNYATSAAGQLQVEIQDPSEKSARRFRPGPVGGPDRRPHRRRGAVGSSGANVGALAGRPVRLRFAHARRRSIFIHFAFIRGMK